FQAEDGIRDFHVTGVQTCALPIFLGFLQSGAEIVVKNEDGTLGKRKVTPRDCAVLVSKNDRARMIRDALREVGVPSVLHTDESRSEERRVGKEWRPRRAKRP